MTKSHRRAGWLVAGLVGLSLVLGAREGIAYGPFRWLDPGPPEMGDPDGPPNSPKASLNWEFKVSISNRWILLVPTTKLQKAPRTFRSNKPLRSTTTKAR